PVEPADLAVGPVGAEPAVDLVQPAEHLVEELLRMGRHRIPDVRRGHRAHHRLGAAQARHSWPIAFCSDCFQASQLYVAPLTWVLHDPLGTAWADRARGVSTLAVFPGRLDW